MKDTFISPDVSIARAGIGDPIVAPEVWLAIDAGGTSTRGVIVTADGECLGSGRAGGGNPISRGLSVAMAAVAESAAAAMSSARVSAASIRGVVVAMAGMGLDVSLEDAATGVMSALGVTAPVRTESDALAAFESGTSDPSGYVLIAGTGAAALRVEAGVVTATADGLGWLLGDVGSGFWLGRRVALAAVEELDGRGPETALTPLVLEVLGIDPDATRVRGDDRRPAAVSDLMVKVYQGPAIGLAALATLAFQVIGDPVSDLIVADAAEALATTLHAVVVPETAGPVVATGGVLAGQGRLRAGVVANMARRGHEIDLIAVPDGLVGAATLALRRGGVQVDKRLHARIHDSLDILRQA